MGMTPAQAKRLGTLIARTRAATGLSVRGLAKEVGVGVGWIAELEAGVYADPSPAALARLAEVLNLDPQRIDRLTKGTVADSLPDVRVYFRAKYGTQLSPAEAQQLLRDLEAQYPPDHEEQAA
jgi:transcriptional regulator with XRE-family HTH domain